MLWPSPPYRRVLEDLTGERAVDLGFIPPGADRDSRRILASPLLTPDAMSTEATLFDTLELAQMADATDISPGTVDALGEAADLLCRAYPTIPAPQLRDRTKQRLQYVMRLLGGRLTLQQHRDLLVDAGWLSLLLGCLHYDLGEREQAEAARQAAYQMGKQTGHAEIRGWAYELAGWFALVENRYEDAVAYAQAGRDIAGTSSAGVQLALQEAKGRARLGDRRAADHALREGAAILGKLPIPEHAEHHFMFDHSKWIFYAATCYTWLDDDDRAEEHALEVIAQHQRPDGTSNAPMRTADAKLDLAVVHARRGELDAAVQYGASAFDHDRKSLTDLIARAGDLDRVLQTRYPGEPLACDFHDRLTNARRSLGHTA